LHYAENVLSPFFNYSGSNESRGERRGEGNKDVWPLLPFLATIVSSPEGWIEKRGKGKRTPNE